MGKILERHCLNEVFQESGNSTFQYDTPIERQKRALKVIIENIEKLKRFVINTEEKCQQKLN